MFRIVQENLLKWSFVVKYYFIEMVLKTEKSAYMFLKTEAILQAASKLVSRHVSFINKENVA